MERLSPPPRDAGLSLLETLVALTLIGVTGALLASALHVGVRVWDASTRRQTDVAAERTLSQIASWIRHAEPRRNSDGVSMFFGQADAVSFILAEPPETTGGGLARYRIQLSDAAQGRPTLLVERTPMRGGASQTRDLLPGVEDFTLAYAGESDDPWRASWGGEDAPPRLVRFTLVMADGRSRSRVVEIPAR